MLTLVALLLTAGEGAAVQQDTWLALVAGREIVQHGLPHHALTTIPGTRSWVDAQWLCQLLMYGVERLGGIGLLALVSAVSVFGAIVGATAAALRLGARTRTVAWVLPLALWCMQIAITVRPQAFAYPLFVLVVYLIIRDIERPTARVFWCLPVLVLWANLHGSVTLGAGAVALHGLITGWHRRSQLRQSARAWARPAALVLAPIVCLFVTPYGAGMLGYYRSTLLNSGFRHVVGEWLPVTNYTRLAVGFFILAAIAVWSFGRHPKATSAWERVSLLALTGAAILTVRNVSWFGLLAVVVVSRSLDPMLGSEPRARGRMRPTPRRAVTILTAVGAILSIVFAIRLVGASPDTLVASRYPADALPVIRTEIDRSPGLRVFSDATYADWLMWKFPQLEHRVAYDISFELLTARELHAVADFGHQTGLNWPRLANGYGLLVLDDRGSRAFRTYFGRQSGTRILYDRNGLIVIRRSPGAHAESGRGPQPPRATDEVTAAGSSVAPCDGTLRASTSRKCREPTWMKIHSRLTAAGVEDPGRTAE